MGRLALVVAGLYVAAVAVYFWAEDPFITRDSTYARMCGCPIALARHRSAS